MPVRRRNRAQWHPADERRDAVDRPVHELWRFLCAEQESWQLPAAGVLGVTGGDTIHPSSEGDRHACPRIPQAQASALPVQSETQVGATLQPGRRGLFAVRNLR